MGAKKEIEQEFLSTGAIAKKMSLSSQAIRKEIYSGKLKAFRFNAHTFMVAVGDFETWKAKRLTPVTDV